MALKLDPKSGEQWAIWGIIAVFSISIFLRFWGLGRFNELVFDEFYYAKFANNYLTHTPFYNSHPPLSQYLIAIGIWIGDRLPIGQDTTNTLTGSLHSTFSYRWMNALFGSLIPLLVAALAYQLNRRMSYAFFAALFISLDGLFLVESRYALNNIFLVFFGILGQLLVLIASSINSDLTRQKLAQRQYLYIIGAGISFGASAACKWNGLWFLLGILIILGIAKLWELITAIIQPRRTSTSLLDAPGERLLVQSGVDVRQRLASINLVQLIFGLGIVPVLTYSILWIPHLIQNPRLNFWEMQLSILNYHEQIGNSAAIHPYCADWYTWPLMLRPLAYYYQQDRFSFGDATGTTQLYYDVHAMGNPFLWWFAIGAISILSIKTLQVLVVTLNMERMNQGLRSSQVTSDAESRIDLPLFIVVNYAANLLPWVLVTRCVFIYHYMGAVLFAIVGLAWLVDTWLRSSSRFFQGMGLTIIFAVAVGFVFWLPIYLGLPVDSGSLSLRMWNFWIFKWI
jgi:dolichyl-phosphate-mannose-protein mannosyltransferase